MSSLAISRAADSGWGVESLRAVASAQHRSETERLGCDSVLLTTGCTFPGPSTESVVLVGDSQAAAISDMVWSVVRERGETFGIWTRPGCPFLVGVPNTERCAEWTQQVTSWLLESKPQVLIVHLAALSYTAAEGRNGRSAEEFAAGVKGIRDLLAPSGTEVVFIGPIPVFDDSPMNRATLLRQNPSPSTLSLDEAERRRADVISAVEHVSELAAFTVLDPTSAVCGDTECSQYRNGWIYRDRGHLSPLGAELLRSLITRSLSDLAPTEQ